MERLTVWDISREIAIPCGAGSSCDDLCKDMDGECERCPINNCLNKLAEYEDAEEEGRLAILPCKVGDNVYVIDPTESNGIYQFVCIDLMIDDGGKVFIVAGDGEEFPADSEYIFFNLSEAEAKLKEMVNDDEEADNG